MAGREFEMKVDKPVEMPREKVVGREIEMKMPTASDTAKDVGMAVATQAPKGMIADTLGLPGFVNDLSKLAVKKLIRGGMNVAEWAGVASPGAADRFEKGAERGAAGIRAAAPFGMPSLPEPPNSGDIEGAMNRAVPMLDYKPKTKFGEYAGSAARMAGSAIMPGMGPGATALGRAGLGAVGGTSAQALGDLGSVFGQEEIGRVVGALAGPAALQGVRAGAKSLANPKAKAVEEVTEAIARDVQAGSASMSPAKIAEAQAAGTTPAVFDMAGNAVEKLVKKYGLAGDDATAAFRRANETIQGRSEIAGNQFAARLTNDHGAVPDAATLQTMIKDASKPEINRVYELARNDPKAAQVWNPQLQALADRDPMRTILRKVERVATDPDAGIVGRGVTGSGIIPRNGVPGELPNLSYWDQAKRELDNLIGKAERNGEKPEAMRLTEMKRKLVAEVDAAVPAYSDARGIAAEAFGAQNSLEAGYNALKKGDAFLSRDFLTKFEKATPQDQNLFRTGVASRLAEMAIEPGGVKKVADTLSSPLMQKRLKSVFGDDAFDAMYGHALANANMAKLKPFAANEQHNLPSFSEAGLSALGGAGALPLITGMTGSTVWHLAGVAAGAALDVGIRAAKGARERAIAPHVMQLLSSTDPADLARLGKLAMEMPEAKSSLQNATTAMAKAGVTYERANPSKAPEDKDARQNRASGGRTSLPDHEAEADRYIAMAERAKGALGRETAPLLKHDDTSIAKALEVANQAL
jgi:hypothetical protein